MYAGWLVSSGPPKTPGGRLGPESVFEVVRDRRDDRALAEEQASLQEQGALVVEQLTPPGADHELRQHHGDDVVVVPGVELVDEAQDGTRERAVGRVHEPERHVGVALAPGPVAALL